jgi:signal transduction histidine kinase
MRGASLRRGLITRLVTALAAIGVLGVIAAYPLGSSYAALVYDRALFDDVATMAERVDVSNGVLHLNLSPVGEKLLLSDHANVRYRVIDLRDGKVVVGNGDLGSWARESSGVGEPQYRDTTVGNSRYRVAYTRHLVDPDDIPVLVEVGETLGKREQIRRQIVGGMVLLLGAMVAAAVALVWKGVASELAPLREIEEAAASRSGANLTPLDASRAPEEVRGLLEAINRMMARLGEAIESQRSFTANAAHQLRTPLAGVRLQAQMALKHAAPDAVRTSLHEIEASTMRATHVLEQLLTLSKAETRELLRNGERVDLAGLSAGGDPKGHRPRLRGTAIRRGRPRIGGSVVGTAREPDRQQHPLRASRGTRDGIDGARGRLDHPRRHRRRTRLPGGGADARVPAFRPRRFVGRRRRGTRTRDRQGDCRTVCSETVPGDDRRSGKPIDGVVPAASIPLR